VQFVYQLGFDPDSGSPLSTPLTPPSNIAEPISYAKDYLHSNGERVPKWG
tara:strand:- start:143 stop:292 length:150 start_codon:yes stop_codon:yes gene_type:complete